MDNSQLKPCPWGCPSNLRVRNDSYVECGHCGATGPEADTLLRKLANRTTDTASMSRAVGMWAWNARGPEVKRKLQLIADNFRASRNSKDFESLMNLKSGPSGKSNWVTCLRNHGSLVAGVEYRLVNADKDHVVVLNSLDQEETVPSRVFMETALA